MDDDQERNSDRQQHDVQAVHLTEIQNVEEGADAGPIHRILGVDGDELRVEVLL